ncbi:hypothetical protein HK101_001058 [Irineochytrium annulatum]|nr:hypothetical protein HK101_001058 [Irineochytrium annulatum]
MMLRHKFNIRCTDRSLVTDDKYTFILHSKSMSPALVPPLISDAIMLTTPINAIELTPALFKSGVFTVDYMETATSEKKADRATLVKMETPSKAAVPPAVLALRTPLTPISPNLLNASPTRVHELKSTSMIRLEALSVRGRRVEAPPAGEPQPTNSLIVPAITITPSTPPKAFAPPNSASAEPAGVGGAAAAPSTAATNPDPIRLIDTRYMDPGERDGVLRLFSTEPDRKPKRIVFRQMVSKKKGGHGGPAVEGGQPGHGVQGTKIGQDAQDIKQQHHLQQAPSVTPQLPSSPGVQRRARSRASRIHYDATGVGMRVGLLPRCKGLACFLRSLMG